MQGAIYTVQRLLSKDGRTFKTEKRPHKVPLPHGYKPEMDTTDECNADHTLRYQQLIRIFLWAVALMSQYQMNPRKVNLEVFYVIFHLLWNNTKKMKVMDSSTQMIDKNVFNYNSCWVVFYGDVAEEDLPQMSEPLSDPVLTSTFVYSDHASNISTRISHTGILLFIYSGIIKAFIKQQNTSESRTLVSELVAPHIAMDVIVELRNKLNSVGVPLKGPTVIYCYNQGVVKNTIVPEYTLNKKHNSINYHGVREVATSEILRTGKEDTATNLAEPLTKLVP